MATNLRKVNTVAEELDTQSFLATKAGIIRALASNMVHSAIEIGKNLVEVQERLKYSKDGGFKKWLADEFEWSDSHAYRFIKLFNTYGNEKSAPHVAHNFSVRTLLTLAAPDVPDDVRKEILKQEKQYTEKEVKDEIAKAVAEKIKEKEDLKKAMDKQIKEKEDLKNEMVKAEEKVATVDARVKELKESHKKRIEKLQKKYTEDLYELQKKINHKPTSSDFEEQTKLLTDPFFTFLINDDFAKILSELEQVKEDIVNEFDMYNLDAVIHALESLSKRARSWAERLTPTNEKWEHRTRKF